MFSTLVFGLIEGRVYGWWLAEADKPFELGDFKWPTDGISIIPVSLAISVIFTVLFVLWERARDKAQKNVLLDLGLFKIASFRNGSFAALIISMGEFGLLFAIPLWLQNVEGLTPVSSGLVLLWLAGGAFLASGVGGAMSGKLPAVRAVQIGVLFELVGVAGIALVASTGGGWWPVAPFLLLYGIGVGLATAQLTGVIMVEVPMEKIGQASGSQSTVRQIGSALGIAVLGTVLFTATQASADAQIREISFVAEAPKEQQDIFVHNISDLVVESAGAALPMIDSYLQSNGIPETEAGLVQAAANDGFTDGVKATGWAAAGFLFLGLLSTFSMGTRRRPEEKKVNKAKA
jgi:hypothetical protein